MSSIHPFQYITFSIYRCLDCHDKRAVTNIPAMIEGVIQEDEVTAHDCSTCRSTNIKTLFQTKDADEFSVYCQLVNLEDEVEDE